MPGPGESDVFEAVYIAKLKALLAPHGLVLDYERDRAAIDTGLHLFLEGTGARQTSQVRVWFQAKGKMAGTLPLEDYRSTQTVAVKVKVDHLRFWFAAPEPVYLVVYIESGDEFIAEDVRDIVERQWPRGTFYAEVPDSQDKVTLNVASTAKLDGPRVAAMLRHRSMRIDGPAFRGRPLGHRYDPIRSQIASLPPATFDRLVERILTAHDFRETETTDIAPDLKIVRGRLYETLSWQSPAFAQYGYDPTDDFRVEPSYETLHGEVVLTVDRRNRRTTLSRAELAAIARLAEPLRADTSLAVIFNSPDLSGTGGLWRRTLRDLEFRETYTQVRQIGLEAITFLVLVTTLVYLDLAPEIAWDHVSYLRELTGPRTRESHTVHLRPAWQVLHQTLNCSRRARPRGWLQPGDLLPVTAPEFGEMAGERGDHVAMLGRSGILALGRPGLLAAELPGAVPDGGVAVEEVQRGRGGCCHAAEGDWLADAQHAVERGADPAARRCPRSFADPGGLQLPGLGHGWLRRLGDVITTRT